ncbi:MAG: phosphate signaling complex protein PhoU [Flavobacteriaceae bacterium]|nr:phosphate signaling complex protein PhoU [Flavobacteriaceae bacterium]
MTNTEQHRRSLKLAGFEMITLCKLQLEKAQEAFINHDEDLAEEVIYMENHINALDLKIEKDCENIFALHSPVAKDLRFTMAILKMTSELERIADHAFNISKYVVDQEKKIESHLFKSLELDTMYETIDTMMDYITVAYENKDVKIARKVFKKDKILDKINKNSFQILEEEIIKDNTLIQQSLMLFSVVKKLERVGDLIKNIAEEIIFYVDAEVLKHKKKKKKN